MSAEWLPVVGFEDRYRVSDDGQVMVLAAAGRGRFNADRVLKPGRGQRGYLQVLLYPGNGAKAACRMVHHLVLEAFIGPRPDGALGLHKDDNRLNNNVGNLRWGSTADNTLDQVRNGLHNHGGKTHCKWGHELSGDNLIVTAKQRSCRECARRRNREYEARKRSALAVYVADTQERAA